MRPSELLDLHRKLDLILQALGVDPDTGKPQGIYCVIYPPCLLLFAGEYSDCLDYLDRARGIRTDMMTLEEYNRTLEAAGYEPVEI